MGISRGSTATFLSAVIAISCHDQKEPVVPEVGPTTGDAFNSGVQCSAVRPQTEPDLMAWDPGSRATLRSVKAQGVVVVHYEAKGCDVQLHVLPNCVAKGSYQFEPYSATETKLARNVSELFAELPLGAAKLSANLKGSRAVRTDYMMAGVESVKIGTAWKREELVGECQDATHVVSKIYVGGFGLAAGEARELEGGASVFIMPMVAVGGGAKTQSSVEHIQHEGVAEACEDAQKKGIASPQCSVPLRVALMSLGDSKVAMPAPTSSAPTSNVRTHGTMAVVPAADFIMGSPPGVGFDDERPMRKRHLEAFEIDVNEVSVADYAGCVRASACTAAATDAYCNTRTPDRGDQPINCVTQPQADAYCKWAGKRLPTEEQWEYAARGTPPRTYPWGENAPQSDLVCWKRSPEGQRLAGPIFVGTCTVGGRALAHGPFGAIDMAGNVAEWTSTRYTRNYGEPEGAGAEFVVRGGSWVDQNPLSLRGAARTVHAAGAADRTIGFRCVQ